MADGRASRANAGVRWFALPLDRHRATTAHPTSRDDRPSDIRRLKPGG